MWAAPHSALLDPPRPSPALSAAAHACVAREEWPGNARMGRRSSVAVLAAQQTVQADANAACASRPGLTPRSLPHLPAPWTSTGMRLRILSGNSSSTCAERRGRLAVGRMQSP